MKILKLRFKNIHSLKGDHLIDFTSEPLLSAGLFAITGPTGAGKSTILDVITLALFNKIPRFATKGTETISKNDIEKIGSVMTHFTDDAYAEIEYETHNQQYRSTWSISRARTGNLRDYEMALATLPDGQIMDLKKSEVPSENEKLLGLKYEQFIKSILLSQGDFARLLKSDDKERAKLLEDLTDSQIYRDIGKAVYENAKVVESELSLLRQQSDMFAILSDEIVESKTLLIYSNLEKTAELTLQIKHLEFNLKKLELKTNLQKQLDETKALIKNLELKKQNFLLSDQRLTKHQKLDTHRNDISVWQNDQLRLNHYLQQKATIQSDKFNANDSVTASLKKMSEMTHTEINESNFILEMKKFENLITEFDQKLSALTEQGIQLRKRLHITLDKQNKEWITEIKSLKTIESQHEGVKSFLGQLKDLPTYFDGDQETLQITTQKINNEIVQLHKQHRDVQQLENIFIENFKIEEALNENQKVIESDKKRLVETEQILKKQKSDLENIQIAKDHLIKVVNLKTYRSQLEPQKPCPLCGSLEHPYINDSLPDINNNIEKTLVGCEKSVFETSGMIQQLTTQIAVFTSQNDTYQQTLLENSKKSGKIKSDWNHDIPTSAEIAEKIIQKEDLLKNLHHEVSRRLNLEIATQIEDILSELGRISKDYQKLRNERSNLYAGSNISDEMNHIQGAYSASRDNLQKIQVTLINLENDINQITFKINQLSDKLLQNLLQLGYTTIQDALADILDDSTYRNLLKEKEILIKEETTFNTTLENIQKELLLLKDIDNEKWEISELKTSITDIQLQKDQINLATGALQNEITQHNHQKQLKAEMLKVLKDKELAANPLFRLNQMIGDATGNKYAKYAQNLSLKQLLSLANRRLEKLSDRYLLMMTDIEDDLRIIDIYQGNTTRSVKTLSGGETFIVSLALALSLADMASKNVQLKSLFIDEGFGTLDNDTLETSLITLEKLQSESDRTIGIISHVESLKERITTQIKLQKNNLGYSNIEIV